LFPVDPTVHEDGLLTLSGSDELQINDQWCMIINYGFPEPEMEDDPEVFNAYMYWKKNKREKVLDESSKVWKHHIEENGGLTAKLFKSESSRKTVKNFIRKHSIPSWYRRYVWIQLTGVDKKIKENRGYYKKILEGKCNGFLQCHKFYQFTRAKLARMKLRSIWTYRERFLLTPSFVDLTPSEDHR